MHIGAWRGERRPQHMSTQFAKDASQLAFYLRADKPRHRREKGYYYFHFRLSRNLNDICHWIIHPHSTLLFVNPLPFVLALALAFILVVRHVRRQRQVAALLLFGLIAETRVLLQWYRFSVS